MLDSGLTHFRGPEAYFINNQYVANSERPPPPVPGREVGGHRTFYYQGDGYFFSPFPPFHLAGWNSIAVYPVFAPLATLVMGSPDRPATPQSVAITHMVIYTGADATCRFIK
jgi:hypothetical protein